MKDNIHIGYIIGLNRAFASCFLLQESSTVELKKEEADNKKKQN